MSGTSSEAERPVVGTASVQLEIPDLWAVDIRLGKHRIRRLRRPYETYTGPVELRRVGTRGRAITFPPGAPAPIWIARDASLAPADAPVLRCARSLHQVGDGAQLEALQWVSPPSMKTDELGRLDTERDNVLAAWDGAFRFNGGAGGAGLRLPQIGALHALLAHWTIADDTATIVMPTGTGKTETMIAALASERLSPLLIVVPSRVLRRQLTRKFLTMGVLPATGVLPKDIEKPVVATVSGALDRNEVEVLLSGCNVIVATMSSLTRAAPEVRAALADGAKNVFIDEAHHVPARTWSEFRDAFAPRRVVQFTATPFRGDGKLLPGKMIYRYPLRKAQEEGYFRSIRFQPVFEFESPAADLAIARAAIEQLDQDLAAGFNHVVMARVDSIARAHAVGTIYRSNGGHGVVVVHTGKTPSERQQALDAIESRAARVVVCVDMLGEGYDLAALKIAALHDVHRGLGITLQFIGRFTRNTMDIGDATAIANVANPKVEEALEELYSLEPDWNVLLHTLSEGVIGRQLRRMEVVDGFGPQVGEVPIQNLHPKMSTVVYRTPTGSWQPAKAADNVADDELYDFAVNDAENLAFLVTRRLERVPWGDVASIANLTFDLVLLYFDSQRQLLFVHSSDTRRLNIELATAVTGGDAELIRGMPIFRVLHGINRLVIANLGLKHALGRSVCYTMYAGANVNEGLSEQAFHNRTTSNLFGFGYELGERASAGCSYKGRLWSYRVREHRLIV